MLALVVTVPKADRLTASPSRTESTRSIKHAPLTYAILLGRRYYLEVLADDEPVEFNRDTGAVGIDINVDHIALCETDRHGNCVLFKTIPMNLINKNRNQRKHIIRNTAKEAVLESVRSNKPFILESLNFTQKKMNMRYEKKTHNRILSEFAYKEITETIKSRCRKEKVAYKEIDPAYTSRIAREKYMKPMGCSIHMAASYVIARRGCGYTEYI